MVVHTLLSSLPPVRTTQTPLILDTTRIPSKRKRLPSLLIRLVVILVGRPNNQNLSMVNLGCFSKDHIPGQLLGLSGRPNGQLLPAHIQHSLGHLGLLPLQLGHGQMGLVSWVHLHNPTVLLTWVRIQRLPTLKPQCKC